MVKLDGVGVLGGGFFCVCSGYLIKLLAEMGLYFCYGSLFGWVG